MTHNQGLVNQAYLDKAGRLARFELGQRAEVPEPYFHQCWELIHDVVGSMAIGVLEKAGP